MVAAFVPVGIARERETGGVKERGGEGRKKRDWNAYQFHLVLHREGCLVSQTRR